MEDYTNASITSTPTPDLIQVGPQAWVREIELTIEPKQHPFHLPETASRQTTKSVIRLLQGGFAHKFEWVKTLSPTDIAITLEQVAPNRVKVRLETGKYTYSDPLWIFGLMTTIRAVEWYFGTIVGFAFNGDEFPDWDLWRMRRMYLGTLLDNEVIRRELHS